MSRSKTQIANSKYGVAFEELEAGEKAAVTRAYNAQSSSPRTSTRRASTSGVKATIGRVGVNGVQTCILNAGATVSELLEQSGYGFDKKKEQILDNDTGNAVSLTTKVKNNGTYAIAVAIKSA